MTPASSYQGACLYLPPTHPRLREVLQGEFVPGLRVAVICLEDALEESGVPAGLDTLRSLPADLRRDTGPTVYVRPRTPDMLCTILDWGGPRRWTGFVLPKLDVHSVESWFQPLASGPWRVMPILETADVFCPTRMDDLFQRVLAFADTGRLDAVRLGAADLFGALGTRRPPNASVQDTIIGPVLAMIACRFMARGVPVAAPVCEKLIPDAFMVEETRRDVESGFIGKTAVNPAQVRLINQAFAVTQTELSEAHAITSSTRAVFKRGDTMCEVGPHSRWATRILARHAAFGLREDSLEVSRDLAASRSNRSVPIRGCEPSLTRSTHLATAPGVTL
jgi:citrate lyase beta subunit